MFFSNSSLIVTIFICGLYENLRASAFVIVGQHSHAGIASSSATRLYLVPPRNNTVGASYQESSSTELSASFADVAAIGMRKVYCDLDGVLADFDKGVINLLGKPPSKLVKGTMWKHIARANAFYENLDFTHDGRDLWKAIRPLKPDILTGVPYPKSSRIEKYNWCNQKLGIDIKELHHVDKASGYRDHESVDGKVPEEGVTNVITCWSNNKSMECSHGSVLIDDRDSLRKSWEAAGGIFIHHTNAKSTIQKLKDHGIL